MVTLVPRLDHTPPLLPRRPLLAPPNDTPQGRDVGRPCDRELRPHPPVSAHRTSVSVSAAPLAWGGLPCSPWSGWETSASLPLIRLLALGSPQSLPGPWLRGGDCGLLARHCAWAASGDQFTSADIFAQGSLLPCPPVPPCAQSPAPQGHPSNWPTPGHGTLFSKPTHLCSVH